MRNYFFLLWVSEWICVVCYVCLEDVSVCMLSFTIYTYRNNVSLLISYCRSAEKYVVVLSVDGWHHPKCVKPMDMCSKRSVSCSSLLFFFCPSPQLTLHIMSQFFLSLLLLLSGLCFAHMVIVAVIVDVIVSKCSSWFFSV